MSVLTISCFTGLPFYSFAGLPLYRFEGLRFNVLTVLKVFRFTCDLPC